jgi:hypothetical protein
MTEKMKAADSPIGGFLIPWSAAIRQNDRHPL